MEDKVAALEARAQMTEPENENSRDLLSWLQSENMVLKQQAAFTFLMPQENALNMANGTLALSSLYGGAPPTDTTSFDGIHKAGAFQMQQ